MMNWLHFLKQFFSTVSKHKVVCVFCIIIYFFIIYMLFTTMVIILIEINMCKLGGGGEMQAPLLGLAKSRY